MKKERLKNNLNNSITMRDEFQSDFYVLGICKYAEKYLLLKIAPDRKWCAGDWDFIAVHVRDYPKMNAEQVLLSGIEDYVGLNGKILNKGDVFVWSDDESKMNWIILPILVEVNNAEVKLNKKYSDYRFLSAQEILNYDRKKYLAEILKNIHLQ